MQSLEDLPKPAGKPAFTGTDDRCPASVSISARQPGRIGFSPWDSLPWWHQMNDTWMVICVYFQAGLRIRFSVKYELMLKKKQNKTQLYQKKAVTDPWRRGQQRARFIASLFWQTLSVERTSCFPCLVGSYLHTHLHVLHLLAARNGWNVPLQTALHLGSSDALLSSETTRQCVNINQGEGRAIF